MVEYKKEEKHHDLVINFIVNVFLYLSTFKKMLLLPRKTFLEFFMTKNPPLIKPGYFLIINIVIIYLIGQLLGYEPKNPFNFSPLSNLLSGYSFIVIKYIVGLFIFLYILKIFSKQKNLYSFLQYAIPILCYSSVVYLPIFITKFFFFENITEGLLKEQSFSLSTLLNIVFGIKFIILFLLLLFCIFWWFLLVYIGIRFSKSNIIINPKKTLIFSSLTYIIVFILLTVISTTAVNYSTLKAFKIIVYSDVEKELIKKPHNFLKAATLATAVSGNTNIPYIFRYIFELKRITCLIAHYSPKDERLMYEILAELSDKNYTKGSTILNTYLKNISSSPKNNKHSILLIFKKQIEDAEELLNKAIYKFRDGPIGFSLGVGHIPRKSEEDSVAYPVIRDDINKGQITQFFKNSYYSVSSDNEIRYYFNLTSFISLFP